MEALYILCQKEDRGELTAQEHATAVTSLQAILLTTVQPPLNGDASLIVRAETLRAGRGCAQSADSVYLALAEELAASGQTELLTFDAGQAARAAALSPAVSVDLLTP